MQINSHLVFGYLLKKRRGEWIVVVIALVIGIGVGAISISLNPILKRLVEKRVKDEEDIERAQKEGVKFDPK